MPSLNFAIQNPHGPLVQVVIGVSDPRQQAMTAAGLPVPNPVTGTFLIDTGASTTCVDPSLIKALGIQPTGSVPIQTPSTQGAAHYCNTYDVLLYIPGGASGLYRAAMPIFETHLKSQGIDGLIGRDILDSCAMFYNGTTGQCTISY